MILEMLSSDIRINNFDYEQEVKLTILSYNFVII